VRERIVVAKPNIPAAEALELTALIAYTEKGIASRVIGRSGGGSVTLFAFDKGQELSEHASPYDAFVVVLEGTLKLTVGGTPVRAAPGSVVRMPANVPHAVESPGRSKMMLVMLWGRDT
jgi:quercetin dioxygenase-like cupin family protein